LPERLPAATWKKIAWYMSNPADLNNPGPGETLLPDERQLIEENFYTDKQMELMVARMTSKVDRRAQPGMAIQPRVGHVLGVDDYESKRETAIILMREGHKNKYIAEQSGLSIPKVVKLRKEIEEGSDD